jgi:hypothetical protein
MIKEKFKQDNERGARRQLIEELFYDFYSSRRKVYWMNFVRGLFFGFGTLLGGTVLVAIIIWLLGQFAGWFPFIGQYIHHIVNTM